MALASEYLTRLTTMKIQRPLDARRAPGINDPPHGTTFGRIAIATSSGRQR